MNIEKVNKQVKAVHRLTTVGLVFKSTSLENTSQKNGIILTSNQLHSKEKSKPKNGLYTK